MKEPSADSFAAALAALRRGAAVVFPTETFYGLGADALDAAAVERVAALKGRGAASPIAVIVADRAMLAQVVSDIPPAAEKLIARFWPGPLTLVLPAKRGVPAPLVNSAGKIGARVSSHPAAARLARELGRPLTATSANPSEKDPARSIAQARVYFEEKIGVYLDGGELTGKAASTVAEISGGEVTIIRAGAIAAEELKKWL
ncbi:MAG TPA: L-threonylcarbamoyladenylate synthase [Candidatus Binatia bacterium]|nr:L-threonylcarbamoyladenylate synthase [Candidatus Binatia bacterium]